MRLLAVWLGALAILAVIIGQSGKRPAVTPEPAAAELPGSFSARVFARPRDGSREPSASQLPAVAGDGGEPGRPETPAAPASIWSAPAQFAPPDT